MKSRFLLLFSLSSALLLAACGEKTVEPAAPAPKPAPEP